MKAASTTGRGKVRQGKKTVKISTEKFEKEHARVQKRTHKGAKERYEGYKREHARVQRENRR